MGIATDNRAQAIQIGAVLIFGILILSLSIYQAFVVPNQNQEIEFNHNEKAQQQMTELRSNVILMPDSTSPRAASVDLGVRYPSRAIFVNPGPASGTVRTVETGNASFNVTINNAEAISNEGETSDFWNGTTVTYNTGLLEYRPDYNLYQNAPRTIYEHSVLYNSFSRENITQAVTDQTIINGNRITLIALNGTMGDSRTGTTSMDFEPVSTRSRTVAINDTGSPITLSLVTGLSKAEWRNSTLENELVSNGGHVQSVSVRDGPNGYNILDITLEQDQQYQLKLAKVGVGNGATETDSAYLTDVEGNGTSVQKGETKQLTVEVRDKFNVPQSGTQVRADPAGGAFTDGNKTASGADGQATFRYRAQSSGTHKINFTIEDGYSPDESHDTSTPRNVTMTVTVPSSTSGGGGGAYNVSWLNPSVGNSAVDETGEDGVYDYDATETATLDLTMETDPATDGAPVEFSVSDKQQGTVSPGKNTTTDNKSATTFEPKRTGEVNVYTSSGGSGDVLTLNVTDIELGNLDIDPDQANKSVVHNWTFQNVRFDGEVDNITLSYPSGSSFDGLDEDADVTVVFTREKASGEDRSEINVRSAGTDLSGSTAVLELDRGEVTNIVGESYVKVDGVDNPAAGEYDWDLTFDGENDTETFTKTESIGEFNVSIDSYNSSVQKGNNLTVEYTITNTGSREDTQTIDFIVEDSSNTQVASNSSSTGTLVSGDTFSGSFEYQVQDGDGPQIEFNVSSFNDKETRTVTVEDRPTFNVTIEGTNSPVTEGDELDVNVTVENTGSAQDTQTIELKNFSSGVVDNTSVQLSSGASTNFNLTWNTSSGDAGSGEINVTSLRDFDTADVTISSASQGGLDVFEATDMIPSADQQQQGFRFSPPPGDPLPANEKVTVILDDPQDNGNNGPEQINYGNNYVFVSNQQQGIQDDSFNDETAEFTWQANSSGLAPSDEVFILLQSANVTNLDLQSGNYTVKFGRGDKSSNATTNFEVTRNGDDAKLDFFEVSNLTGVQNHDLNISFAPANGGFEANEWVTIELENTESGIDYSNNNGVSIVEGQKSGIDFSADSGTPRVVYKAPDTGYDGNVTLSVSDVVTTADGVSYEVSASRGGAGTTNTTLNVTEGADGFESVNATDIVTNATQQQTFTFTLNQTLPASESFTLTLPASESPGSSALSYSNGKYEFEDGTTTTGDISVNTNNGQIDLEPNNTPPEIPAGTTVEIRMKGTQAGGPSVQSNPYEWRFNRTDLSGVAFAESNTTRDRRSPELKNVTITDLIGTDEQDMKISFTPTTEMVTLGGIHETVVLDIGEIESMFGNVDSDEVSVTQGPGSATLSDWNNGKYIEYEKPSGSSVAADTDITITVEKVSPSNADLGENFTVGLSRGAANTTNTTVSAKKEPANFTVNITGTNSPVVAGDDMLINATINNTGVQQATQTVALEIDGSEVDTSSVTLAGADSPSNVTFTWNTTGQSGGEYTANVSSDDDFETTNVTVLEWVTVDDFEDGNVSEYDRGDTTDFSTTESYATSGSKSLEEVMSSVDPADFIGSRPNRANRPDLNYYPERGDKIRFNIRYQNTGPGGQNGIAGLIFGGTDYDNTYAVQLDVDQTGPGGEEFELIKDPGNLTGGAELAAQGVSYQSDEWYTVEVQWGENSTDSTITATLINESGTQVAEISAENDSPDVGLVGFSVPNGEDDWYWDDVEALTDDPP